MFLYDAGSRFTMQQLDAWANLMASGRHQSYDTLPVSLALYSPVPAVPPMSPLAPPMSPFGPALPMFSSPLGALAQGLSFGSPAKRGRPTAADAVMQCLFQQFMASAAQGPPQSPLFASQTTAAAPVSASSGGQQFQVVVRYQNRSLLEFVSPSCTVRELLEKVSVRIDRRAAGLMLVAGTDKSEVDGKVEIGQFVDTLSRKQTCPFEVIEHNEKLTFTIDGEEAICMFSAADKPSLTIRAVVQLFNEAHPGEHAITRLLANGAEVDLHSTQNFFVAFSSDTKFLASRGTDEDMYSL